MKVGYAKITVGDACYLYDTTTNAIVSVTPAVHAVLEDYLRLGSRAVLRKYAGQLPAEELGHAVEFLRACRGRGMLQPMRLLNYLPSTNATRLRRLYAQGLSRMTLMITEQCNQRCRYCQFGGAGRGARRSGTMDWGTARQSIDYLLSHAAGRRAPTLELFGGEPVLSWPVIRQAILYLRQHLRRPDVEIVLYTNATLLDRAKLELLVVNKVVLQVSLDGPAQVHDRDRVLADGRGTHSDVLRVLNRIRRRDPVYYRKYLRLRCTFSLESDLLEVFQYFSRAMFRDLRISFGYRVSPFRIPKAVRIRHERQLDELVGRYLRAMRERRPFHRALFARIVGSGFGALELRRVGKAGRWPMPNSVCVPGQTKLFVSGDGTFSPCEHYNQTGSTIGCCRRGIDFRKAEKLLQDYARLCSRMCQGCWAWRLCAHCFIHSTDKDGCLSRICKEKNCRFEKEDIVKALHRYVSILRNEPARASKMKHTLRYSVRHQEIEP
jgi:uncharacterized protein